MVIIAIGVYVISSLILSTGGMIMTVIAQDRFSKDAIYIGLLTGFIAGLALVPSLIHACTR